MSKICIAWGITIAVAGLIVYFSSLNPSEISISILNIAHIVFSFN